MGVINTDLGVVYKPDDILNRRKRIDVVTRDLNPGVRELVTKIIDSWNERSLEDLKQLVGEDRAKKIALELGLLED
ncbi:MAG: hypothetical protein NZ873_00635 [Crenarchaeota archaeon]|nr:hypothetical protein [Thermoproteota archaeon]MDW8033537.1 hypothetical protein [Nitrososphaerota archaeon]